MELNPFPTIPNTQKQVFLVFDFHPFFDGLIGYESLKNLNADIITSTNELKFPFGKVKMKRKYPDSKSVYLNAHESKTINISTRVNGDFLLENDLVIEPNVVIHAGLYSADNENIHMLISNYSDEVHKIDLNSNILNPEINNFETGSPPEKYGSTYHLGETLRNQLRINHQNVEEKRKLLKVIANHENVFFREGTQLSFTNAIKHTIKTKDDLPVHVKSYRYPFCHKEEVKRQISKLLDQGIIRHSISPWTSPVWIVPKKMDASGKKK